MTKITNDNKNKALAKANEPKPRTIPVLQDGQEATGKLSDADIKTLAEYQQAMCGNGDIKSLALKIGKEILPKLAPGQTLTTGQQHELVQNALCIYGLDTQALLVHSVTDKYMGLAVNLVNQLVTEFDCKTPSEKALAQIAAVSYAKSMDYSEEMRNSRAIKFHSGPLNGYFSMIGKEVDRANRTLISALAALKQLKAPSIEFNVTAKTAFVANNQQFNVNQKTNPENIDPK